MGIIKYVPYSVRKQIGSAQTVNGGTMMDEPHIVQECICLKCYYRWIDVRPVGVKLKDLECPGCHQFWYVIGTGEPITEE